MKRVSGYWWCEVARFVVSPETVDIDIGYTQCATEIQLLNTPRDQRHCRQAMTRLWCSSINTLCFLQKTGTRIFARGGDSDFCHQDYVVTWQHRLQLLDSNFNLDFLIRPISVIKTTILDIIL